MTISTQEQGKSFVKNSDSLFEFFDEPWNPLLQIVRNNNSADFSSSGNPFTFFEGHQARELLWETLVLLSLHETLKNHVVEQKNGDWTALFDHPATPSEPTAMPNTPIKDKYLEELTTRDPNAEPHIAGLTKQNMTNPPQRGNQRRLYNPAHDAPASHPDRAIDNQPSPLIYLNKASRNLAITCDTETRLLLPTVSVRLRESTLTKVCGDYWLLYINVFVYRGEARTRIPAEIIDETEEEVDGEVYITFTLELEQWVIDALDVRLGEGVQSPQAGFSGTEGEGQLAVVIIQP